MNLLVFKPVSSGFGLSSSVSFLFWSYSLCICRPSEQEVRKRHKEYMIRFHPDKAPAGKQEEYTEKAARLNRAKEIVLRAQGLSDDCDSSSANIFDPFNAVADTKSNDAGAASMAPFITFTIILAPWLPSVSHPRSCALENLTAFCAQLLHVLQKTPFPLPRASHLPQFRPAAHQHGYVALLLNMLVFLACRGLGASSVRKAMFPFALPC